MNLTSHVAIDLPLHVYTPTAVDLYVHILYAGSKRQPFFRDTDDIAWASSFLFIPLSYYTIYGQTSYHTVENGFQDCCCHKIPCTVLVDITSLMEAENLRVALSRERLFSQSLSSRVGGNMKDFRVLI